MSETPIILRLLYTFVCRSSGVFSYERKIPWSDVIFLQEYNMNSNLKYMFRCIRGALSVWVVLVVRHVWYTRNVSPTEFRFETVSSWRFCFSSGWPMKTTYFVTVTVRVFFFFFYNLGACPLVRHSSLRTYLFPLLDQRKESYLKLSICPSLR